MAQIAIIGVGAIGSVVGAALISSHRHELTLCAHRATFTKLVIRTRDGVVEVAASPIIDEKEARPVEWALLCTKAHQTASAAGWLRALTPAKIAVLQNGVEHVARVSSIANGAAILPVIVRCPAKPLAPGEVNQQGPASLVVRDDAFGAEFAALFAGTGVAVPRTSDFLTESWVKLCQNAVNGAVCGLTVRTIAVIRQPLVADFARKLALEMHRGWPRRGRAARRFAGESNRRANGRGSRRRASWQFALLRSHRGSDVGVRSAQWRRRAAGAQAWYRDSTERCGVCAPQWGI